MLTQLTTGEKVVGAKQARRVLNDGRGKTVYLAMDADPRVTEPILQLSQEKRVPVVQVQSMRELGHACAIAVGAAVAVLI